MVDNRWTLKATTGEVATWTRLKGETESLFKVFLFETGRRRNNQVNPFTYTANDCSVGDLDGDGEAEIILKWSPSNSKRPYNVALPVIPIWMHIKWMEPGCGVLIWDRMYVPGQPLLIFWSLILMEMDVRKLL